MMRNLSKAFILTLPVFFLLACTKEKKTIPPLDPPPNPLDSVTLIIDFQATGNGEPIQSQQSFTDPLGRSMYIETFKYYVSNIYLLDGLTKVPIWDVGLIVHLDNGNASANGFDRKIGLKAPVGQYSGIGLSMGLSPEQNASDPVSYPNDHPLSANRATYWETWSKYRFMFLDGRADLNNDDVFDDLFGYHTGLDTCYRDKAFIKSIEIKKGSQKKLIFTVDINDIFFGPDTLDFAIEKSWHGDTALVSRAVRLSNNLQQAMNLQ